MGIPCSIFWEGRIPLSSVTWSFDPAKSFQFSSSFEERRQKIWKGMKAQFPHLYDGKILILSQFSFEKDKLVLNTRSMRFSQILVHLQDGLKVPEYGSLGFQAIVTNPPSHTFILVGERSHNSEYKPGFYSIPGGIFESDDVRNSLTNACVRELDEEIEVPLNINSFYLIAMLPEANQLGTCLLIEVETTEEHARTVMPNLKVTGNEEWKGNQLEWLSFSQICELNKKRLMEGLSFLRAKFCQ